MIGISQVATKNDIAFKQLFCSRMSFFSADPSALSTVVGFNVGDIKLNKRDFVLIADQLVVGHTYDK